MMNYGSPAFGISHVSTHTNLWSEFPRVTDLLPRVLSKSTALILFETSAISDQYQINGPSNSSLITDRDILWYFGAFILFFPLECSVPKFLDMAPRVHFQINNKDLL
jgi:hypothetical protein